MYGLLGEKLSHSRSPQIHGMIGAYPYCLFEVPQDKLDDFFAEKAFHGINVTVPYKETVMGYCDELTEVARRIGSVNTIVKRPDGTLLGHNTDYDGFLAMVSRSGLQVAGKKCLVLGSGGASKTVVTALSDLSSGQIVVISRSGKDNYKNISKHFDGQIIVNTTPVGMYPHCDATPLSLDGFDRLEGVFDLIYNPRPTRLLSLADEKGVPAVDGLYMLVCQAIAAAERFFDRPIGYDGAEKILLEVAKTL